jgi:hypothetical protein
VQDKCQLLFWAGTNPQFDKPGVLIVKLRHPEGFRRTMRNEAQSKFLMTESTRVKVSRVSCAHLANALIERLWFEF